MFTYGWWRWVDHALGQLRSQHTLGRRVRTSASRRTAAYMSAQIVATHRSLFMTVRCDVRWYSVRCTGIVWTWSMPLNVVVIWSSVCCQYSSRLATISWVRPCVPSSTRHRITSASTLDTSQYTRSHVCHLVETDWLGWNNFFSF